ncbi:hypothetical protein BSZ39_07245 [Bowdeniella nasicola]|uniref:Phage holin family protein n=1 Tax=Bowdeniella nasicola TaxID=208480 RepID=A0A1Q5Q292_9ACTO|nr:phage holin family protein [Bowdeniella nasicola]OKL53839.1 hypothetical protein BSZ39_07245 [Bowdeniella nasicola]
MSFVVRLVVSAFAIWLASVVVSGIELAPTYSIGQKLLALLVVALFFTLVNMFVRPIVKILSLPLYILTLGLFSLVVNALMLMLTGWISSHTEFALTVDGFASAFFGGIIIALAVWAVNFLLPERLETRR